MAQQFWTFHDQSSVEHTFGIYHGEDSGHLVAYLDDRVMIIDFGILDDKSYNFFFERELLKLDIHKNGSGFDYTLNVDKKTPTELNVEIKKERKEEIHIIILILLIVAMIILTFYLRFLK
jgi:hypothetical protein